MKLKLPLHVHISVIFFVLILLVGSLIAHQGYRLSRDVMTSSAAELVRRVGLEMRNEIASIITPAELATKLLSQSTLPRAVSFDARMAAVPLMAEALQGSPSLSSIYVGYPNGDFFFLRHIADATDKAEQGTLGAPANTRFIVQAIEHSGPVARGRYVYLDAALAVLRTDEQPDYAQRFDPRTRPWFKNALASAEPIKTAPYLFFSNRKVGMTLAVRDGQQQGMVIGADILLETLAENLVLKKITPGSQIALVNAASEVIAHESLTKPLNIPLDSEGKPQLLQLSKLNSPQLVTGSELVATIGDQIELNHTQLYNDDSWQLTINTVSLKGLRPLYLVVATPESELLHSATELRRVAMWVTLLVIFISIPVTWLLARRIARPLQNLSALAGNIRRFDFSGDNSNRSSISEVDELGQAMNTLRRSMRRFIDTSRAVADEPDFDRLMPMLLGETIAAADADLGILYLADDERLVPASALDDQGKALGLSLSSVSLADAIEHIGHSLGNGEMRSGELSAHGLALAGLNNPEAAKVMSGLRYGVAVPLRNRRQHLVGAMLLARRKPIDSAQLSFVGNLAVSAASSLETRELIKAQKDLFEAFIQLIAGAIDAKSPYTGGHCARVPELTKMLAREACAQTSGPFADFSLDEDDWEAVHVAAWLHDCGKITTPEYVVDKATKLETIYDRIHEIRMRFEVLKRDADIAYWQGLAEGGDKSALVTRRLAAHTQLDEDFAFVATCNEGGEFMAPEKVERLSRIAQQTWQRTLDDRIGISTDESKRKSATPAAALPATETLLSDKPEHIFARSPQETMPEDNPWGFRVKVPKHLYNKGELYNLSVSRGTLAEEDRFKINEHMIQTIKMLSALPFPKHLRNVPEIAGGHHEKMDGMGYPKRLMAGEMSPVARMMAVADIFEALTAGDRPYKKGKSLSEAIKIMGFMKKDQHIDPEVFDLFLRSGIYLDYGKRYMDAAQLDEVDIQPYLTPAPSIAPA
jgi:HD-GYP domain-containing protein (c-di-GMP phosphodiesterase class II)/HAMP domain-containing protein